MDDHLWDRRVTIVSMRSLCGKNCESYDHLMSRYSFADSLWNWRGSLLSCHIDTQSSFTILAFERSSWSPQMKDVFLASISFVVWCHLLVPFSSAISMISSKIKMTGNHTKAVMNSSISEFQIMKKLDINGHPRRADRIKEVMWYLPKENWVKCNSDESPLGCPGVAGWAGIFRNHIGSFLGYCTANLGHIFREDNICTDKLAHFASSLNDFCWWNSAPIFIAAELNRNRIECISWLVAENL
ncbi:hypothetical protein HKD37_01G001790 [Glycine soja]